MHEFDYRTIPKELMNYEIMNLVSAIHEYKGKTGFCFAMLY